jgi:oxygen-independent coproporphyrinogen-3 oxidase
MPDWTLPASPYSLYLHIPFCRHRCAYCDFNTYAGLESLAPAYCQALRREIRLVAVAAGRRLAAHTVFFGGGTPSLLPAAEIAALLAEIRAAFDLHPQAEITLEANPGTVDLAYLHALRQAGVNRLSLGVQSANPGELRLLERQHDYPAVIRAVADARRAGFNHLNLDLIFGLPQQPLSAWQRTLELALGLRPQHFSLYALTLEHGTPMQRWAANGLLPLPDPDLAADMYEWAAGRLAQAGYLQYEISNWALPGADGEPLACRHNLQYWRSLPYLGLGAGAHGWANGVRTANVLSPQAYIQRCLESAGGEFPRSPATAQAETPDRQAAIGELMMMSLRLTLEGVSSREFQRRFGVSLEQQFSSQIRRLTGLGLLEWHPADPDRLRLTSAGRLLGNQVFVEFI